MALVNGPLFSLQASGKLADAIVFSRWKGRPYVREAVTPSNPKSAAQVAMRACMRFCAQAWAAVGAAAKGSWDDIADAKAISAFNAFTAYNVREFRNGLYPTQGTPPNRTLTADDLTAFAAADQGRDIVVTGTVANVQGNGWGVALHRSTTTGFTPAWNNVVGMLEAASNDSFEFIDGPLDADTYYYRATLFEIQGSLLLHAAEVDATVA